MLKKQTWKVKWVFESELLTKITVFKAILEVLIPNF